MSILGFKEWLNVIIFQPSEFPTIVKAQPPDPSIEVEVEATEVPETLDKKK